MLEESPIGNNISLEKKNYVATLIEKQFKGKNQKKKTMKEDEKMRCDCLEDDKDIHI